MGMTPERAATRIAEIIESLCNAGTNSFSVFNSREALNYVAQVHKMGLISDVQRRDLESAIYYCWQELQPKQIHGSLPPMGLGNGFELTNARVAAQAVILQAASMIDAIEQASSPEIAELNTLRAGVYLHRGIN